MNEEVSSAESVPSVPKKQFEPAPDGDVNAQYKLLGEIIDLHNSETLKRLVTFSEEDLLNWQSFLSNFKDANLVTVHMINEYRSIGRGGLEACLEVGLDFRRTAQENSTMLTQPSLLEKLQKFFSSLLSRFPIE